MSKGSILDRLALRHDAEDDDGTAGLGEPGRLLDGLGDAGAFDHDVHPARNEPSGSGDLLDDVAGGRIDACRRAEFFGELPLSLPAGWRG